MPDISSFTSLQLDAIKEVGNIGAGNAATSLSKLLGCVVEMDVPKADLVSIYELSEYYGIPTTPVAAVFVRSTGAFSCSIIFIESEETGSEIVQKWIKGQFGDSLPTELPDDMMDSAIAEVGNIILGSFLNAINMLIGTNHQISVPGVAHDMLGSILDVVASIFGQLGETALVVNTTLRLGDSENHQLGGNVIMLPDPEALDLLLGKLQVL